jgi:hypothetical protein
VEVKAVTDGSSPASGAYGIPQALPASKMGAAPVADGSLEARTREALAYFGREDKGYAFNDSGEGTAYAEQFAGLLREWLDRAPEVLRQR